MDFPIIIYFSEYDHILIKKVLWNLNVKDMFSKEMSD